MKNRMHNFIEKFKTFFLNQKVNFVFHFSVILILFYVQTDSMLFSLKSSMRIVEFSILAFVFLVCFFRAIILKIKLFDFHNTPIKRLIVLIALFVVSFLFNCFNTFNIHRYLIQIANIAIAFLVTFTMDLKIIKKCFVAIVVIFAGLSLILFVPYYINENVFSFLPIVKNASGYNYYFAVFNFLFIRSSSGYIRRNYGIFREPGVYGVFLVFALSLVLFPKEKKRIALTIVNTVILVLTILSTLSTTTLIATAVLCLFKLFEKNKNPAAFWIKTSVLAIFSIFIILIIFVPKLFAFSSIIQNVFGKFSFENSSFTSRFFDTVMTIIAFFTNPVFGVGFGGLHSLLTEIASAFNVPTNGGINSVLQVFAVHGLLFGCLSVWSIKNFYIRCYHPSKTMIIGIVVSTILTIMNEDLCNSFFFFFVIMIGLLFEKERTIVNKEEYYCVNI